MSRFSSHYLFSYHCPFSYYSLHRSSISCSSPGCTKEEVKHFSFVQLWSRSRSRRHSGRKRPQQVDGSYHKRCCFSSFTISLLLSFYFSGNRLVVAVIFFKKVKIPVFLCDHQSEAIKTNKAIAHLRGALIHQNTVNCFCSTVVAIHARLNNGESPFTSMCLLQVSLLTCLGVWATNIARV